MRVVLGHVALQLLGVRSLRRLPAGLFLGVVEVVREVFGVGVAHFPSGWETGFSLRVLAEKTHIAKPIGK